MIPAQRISKANLIDFGAQSQSHLLNPLRQLQNHVSPAATLPKDITTTVFGLARRRNRVSD